jgi:hypothetical protein
MKVGDGVDVSPYAEPTRKLVSRGLNLRGNWFPVCSAYAEIGFPWTEHMRKLVSHGLSIRGKHFCALSVLRSLYCEYLQFSVVLSLDYSEIQFSANYFTYI